MLTIQVAEDYTDAEDLLHSLHAQFKTSSQVNFHGTYPITCKDPDLQVQITCSHRSLRVQV